MDLTHAFDFVETFIIDREATLYDKEVDLIKRRLFLEMVGIMKGSEFRVRESIKDDPIVMKAKEILQDQLLCLLFVMMHKLLSLIIVKKSACLLKFV